MTEAIQKITNDLVFYQKYEGKMNDLVSRLETPLSAIKPEVRVVTEDGMYVAGLFNLHLNDKYLKGNAFLKAYTDMDIKTTSEPNIQDSIMSKLFGAIIKPDIVHDGKRYSKKWSVVSGQSYGSLIIGADYNNKSVIYPSLIDRLKSDLINERQIVLSNDLSEQLFSPLFKSLQFAYDAMMNR